MAASRGVSTVYSRSCSALTRSWCEVDLPLVVSASAIEAYVEHMRFLVLEVPGVYSLRTKLPHYVDDEVSTAESCAD